MESQTQTTTKPPASGTTDPGNKTAPDINVSNGNHIPGDDLLTDNKLPDPKPAPKEIEQPEDSQSLESRMASQEEQDENVKQWEAYNNSDWAKYLALKEEVESVTGQGFVRPGEYEDNGQPVRNILANMSFRNGHEVNEHLLTQLRTVFETEADQSKREEGYRYLQNVVAKHESLKKEWEYNVKQMDKWARQGYPGDFELTFLDAEGNPMKSSDARKVVDKDWNKLSTRREAPPEQSKVARLPPSETLDNVRAEVGKLLEAIAQHPEQIRGESGNRLGLLNDTISQMSLQYVAKYNSEQDNDEDKVESLIDQRVPDVRIVQMIVEFAEHLIRSGENDLNGVPQVAVEYDLLRVSLKRAGHPDEWFNIIETIVKQKVELARNFMRENPGRDYHEHPDFWQADLVTWLVEKINTTGHHTSSQFTAHPMGSEGMASSQQPVTPQGSSSDGATPSMPSEQVEMEGVTSHGASTEQFPLSGNSSATSAESVLDKKVLYEGQHRSVGGVRPKGFGYQYLVRTNDETAANPFWLLIAASRFGRGEAKNYLDEGGYLVQTTKKNRDADRKKKNWVEGLEEHIGDRLGSDFVMKGIATAPRESGVNHTLWPDQIIQGHFKEQDPKLSRFYAFHTLAGKWGPSYVDELILKHMNENGFPMQAAPTKPRLPRSKPGQVRSAGIDREGTTLFGEQTTPMGRKPAGNHRADGGWTIPETTNDTASLQAFKTSIMTEVETRLEDQRRALQADFSQKMTAGFESQKADMASTKTELASLTQQITLLMTRLQVQT